MMHPQAIFLDRDGVINVKAPEGEYVTSWAGFTFAPGALEGLAQLATLGVPLVVVTNQRGVARGHLSESDLAQLHERMRIEVHRAGGRLDVILHCPHEGGCLCRKPGTLLFERAARQLGFELRSAAVVGDRASDMQAAEALGALRVLVGAQDEPMPAVDYRAKDLAAAARWLCARAARVAR